jgi:hypothetical protein
MRPQNNVHSNARPDHFANLVEQLPFQIPSDYIFRSYRLKSVENALRHLFDYVLNNSTLRQVAFNIEMMEEKEISHATLCHNFSKLEPVLVCNVNKILQERQSKTYRRLAQDSSILPSSNLKINVLYDIDDGICVGIQITHRKQSDTKMDCNLTGEHRVIADAGYCYAKTIDRHIKEGHHLIYNCSIHNLAMYEAESDLRLDESSITEMLKDKDFIDLNVRCGMSSKSGHSGKSKSKESPKIFSHKLRLVGIKATERHAHRRLLKMQKTAKKCQYTLRAVTIAFSKWFFLITNLPSDEYSVMRLFNTYRARWSVERWFWRAKHILNFDKTKFKTETMIRIELLCKILIALLWENERPTVVCRKNRSKVLSDHNFWVLCRSVWRAELQKGLLPSRGWGANFNWSRYASASHSESSTTRHLIESCC